jgi:hypothetical protein
MSRLSVSTANGAAPERLRLVDANGALVPADAWRPNMHDSCAWKDVAGLVAPESGITTSSENEVSGFRSDQSGLLEPPGMRFQRPIEQAAPYDPSSH